MSGSSGPACCSPSSTRAAALGSFLRPSFPHLNRDWVAAMHVIRPTAAEWTGRPRTRLCTRQQSPIHVPSAVTKYGPKPQNTPPTYLPTRPLHTYHEPDHARHTTNERQLATGWATLPESDPWPATPELNRMDADDVKLFRDSGSDLAHVTARLATPFGPALGTPPRDTLSRLLCRHRPSTHHPSSHTTSSLRRQPPLPSLAPCVSSLAACLTPLSSSQHLTSAGSAACPLHSCPPPTSLKQHTSLP